MLFTPQENKYCGTEKLCNLCTILLRDKLLYANGVYLF